MSNDRTAVSANKDIATPEIIDLHPPEEAIRDLMVDGLGASSKTLPCRLFYDERGSELFELICEQPEYYLTRTELAILREHLPEMADMLGPKCDVIEYGSGSSIKSRLLLHALHEPAVYIPVEISCTMLEQAVANLRQEFPNLEIMPVCADYMQDIDLPRREGDRRMEFFPGSTIGNFHRDDALRFLKRSARFVGGGGALLIGVDLIKDPAELEAAYNDAAGITSEFNINLLDRINRELDADFDCDWFRFRAIWNPELHRIESYLISERDQTVHIDGETFAFATDERIRTECSYKYDLPLFAELAAEAGFEVEHVWTDPQQRFSVQYLVAT